MAEWTCDSNESFHLQFVRAKEDSDALVGSETALVDKFHPRFTYPIYGDEEKIYGYKGLKINLSFMSGSLREHLSITYDAKLASTATAGSSGAKAVGAGGAATTVDDPEKILYQFIPPDYFKDRKTFEAEAEKDAINFKPMGTKIWAYTRPAGSAKGKGKGSSQTTVSEEDENVVVYEAYHATWDTPGFLEYHRRMQLFILLYIEAGSYLQEDEDQWEFVILFEKRKRKDGQIVYHFVGYSSLYPFYYWPNSTRLRLSQFVIAKPYQKQGHGSGLYQAIYNFVLSQKRFAELTVEDPSEDFEDLRDRNDLRMLLNNDQFVKEAYAGKDKLVAGNWSKKSTAAKLQLNQTHTETDEEKEVEAQVVDDRPKLGPPVRRAWAGRWRKRLKLAGRQYDRLIEMLILRALDPKDEKAQRAFRLQVKGRLLTFNFEALAQLEQEEQFEKLEETFQNVKEDYFRILKMIE